MDSLFSFIISFNFAHGWHKKDKEKHEANYKSYKYTVISKSYFISLKLQIKTVHRDTNRFLKAYYKQMLE